MIFIEGEKVLEFCINGDESGLLADKLYTLKDTYNKLKQIKAFDKSKGIEDTYFITCNTETTSWGEFVITTYKGKYKLKAR